MEVDTQLYEALEKFNEAQKELNKFSMPFKREMMDSWLTVSCPQCSVVFWHGDCSRVSQPLFGFPIICCNKILH